MKQSLLHPKAKADLSGWKVCFLHADDIFPRQICALGKTTPAPPPPYEMTYFSSMFYKFCALDWPLRAWQFVCARKFFSTHFILSSLANLLLPINSKLLINESVYARFPRNPIQNWTFPNTSSIVLLNSPS